MAPAKADKQLKLLLCKTHRGKLAHLQLDAIRQIEATTAMQKDCHRASSCIVCVLPYLSGLSHSGSMQMLLTRVLLLRHNSMMRRLPVDNEGKDKDKGKKDNIMAACQASSQS